MKEPGEKKSSSTWWKHLLFWLGALLIAGVGGILYTLAVTHPRHLLVPALLQVSQLLAIAAVAAGGGYILGGVVAGTFLPQVLFWRRIKYMTGFLLVVMLVVFQCGKIQLLP